MESWVTAQDERGVLYFGCYEVLTFDGERWRDYPVPGSYAVRGMALGTNGRLWVGATNEVGYFDRTEEGLSAYHSLLGHLPEKERGLGDVWQVLAQGNGAIFVTTGSILVWDGKAFQRFPMQGARRLQAIRTNDKIYVCNRATGVWIVGTDGPRKFISSDVLKGAGVVFMEMESSDWLFVTSAGLYHLADGELSEFGAQASEFIRKNVPLSACRLPSGNLCVGTFNGGLAIISSAGVLKRVVTTEDGLLSNAAYSVFVAGDDALWVTSPVGLTPDCA